MKTATNSLVSDPLRPDCRTRSFAGRRVFVSSRILQAPSLLFSQLHGGSSDVLLQMFERACPGDWKNHR